MAFEQERPGAPAVTPHLRERELAQRLGVSQRTLQRWRNTGYGPSFLRAGGAIRYRLVDVLEFESSVLFRSEEGE